ncbi:MAG: LamG-like jellyroll fold domain-containing protein [Planctomycetota bacterium]
MRKGKKTNLVILAVLGILILCGTTRADLTDGLVAHWEFDEGTGDIAYDSAGGNDGTIYGAQWSGGALDFDGVNDYVDIPYNSSLDIDASGGITISAWIKLRSYPVGNHGGPIFGLFYEGNTKNSLTIARAVDGSKISWDQYPPSGGYLASIKPDLDVWYHVTAVQDSIYRAIYINGDLYLSDNNPESYSGNTPDIIRIGNRSHVDHYFDGTIDDVRIYNRALTASEITELHHGTLVGLEIVGPNEVAEDSSASYKAIAVYDNARTIDVTDLTDWSVDDATIASVAAGLLQTEIIDLPQHVTITAEYTGGDNTEAAEKQVSIFAICPGGYALDFDGDDDYVDIPYDSSLDIDPSGGITVSAWIKLSSYPGGGNDYGSIFSLFADGGIKNSLAINKNRDGNKITWAQYPPSDGDLTSIKPDLDIWYHVVAVQDSTYRAIYINGELDSSDNNPESYSGSTPDTIRIGGGAYDWAGVYFDGSIDDFRIYNRALSAEEIWANMHRKLTGDEDGLVAYWDFDEGQGQVAGDSAGDNHGTLGSTPDVDNSDPNWTDSIPPVGICSEEGIVERNLLNVLGMKNDALDILDEAIGKEEALWEYMDIVFKDQDFGNTSKGDVVKAKQKIHSAIRSEVRAETAVEKSLRELMDALEALDIELDVSD